MEDTSSVSPSSALPQMRFGKIDDLISRVVVAIDGARNSLFSEQKSRFRRSGLAHSRQVYYTISCFHVLAIQVVAWSTPTKLA